MALNIKPYENILGFDRRIRENFRKAKISKINKSIYTSRAVDYAKDQARAIIADLQNRGYTVNGKMIDMFEPDRGKKYTTSQAKSIIEKAKPANILGKAYIEHVITQPGQAKPVIIKLRYGRELEDLGNKYISAAKRALKETPSISLASSIYRNIRILEKEAGEHILVGTTGKSDKEIRLNLAKYLPSAGYAKRVFKPIDYERATTGGTSEFLIKETLTQSLQYFSNKGALTKAAKKELQVMSQIQKRGISRRNASLIVDFFQNATVWSRYRAKLGRGTYASEEAVNSIEEALTTVEDLGGTNSWPLLNMELSKMDDIDDIIERYLEWIIENTPE